MNPELETGSEVHRTGHRWMVNSSADQTEEGAFRQVISFQLRNAGAGPARVEWLRIDLDSKPVENWHAFMQLMQAEASAAGANVATISRGQLITSDVPQYLQANGKIASMYWPRTSKNAPLWDYVNGVRVTDRFRLQACYCSIFDECGVADSKVFRPKPVEQCEAGSE